MSKTMRGKIGRGIFLGGVLAIAMATSQARAESSPSTRDVVLVSRNASGVRGEFHVLHRQMRRERVVRRHFRGPRVIGVDGGAVAVPVPIPVPQENEDVYPMEPSFGGFDYRPFPPPPPVVVAPQIIILPDVHPGLRKVAPREAIPHALIVPKRVAEIHRHRPRHHESAYRIFTWPVAYIGWAYVGALVPITFAPCNDPPHSAIFNTPCGVRPFE